jgi:hydrogenase expression/formation protein HypC
MCVGVPAQVVAPVDPATRQVVVEAQGVRRRVDATLLVDELGQGLVIGDWVLLHVGFAMSILDEEEARRTIELLTLLGGDDDEFEAYAASVEPPARP